MSTHGPDIPRELHTRECDGIDVTLLWSRRDGRVQVSVVDTRHGGHFCVDVRDGENAMEVFHHPFAYAASRGIDTTPAAALIR